MHCFPERNLTPTPAHHPLPVNPRHHFKLLLAWPGISGVHQPHLLHGLYDPGLPLTAAADEHNLLIIDVGIFSVSFHYNLKKVPGVCDAGV